MDNTGDLVGNTDEELPQMDGTCDSCEPDEAQPATHVCHTCSFAFCQPHADRHSSRTRHPLMPYIHAEHQENGPNREPSGVARDELGQAGLLAMQEEELEMASGHADKSEAEKSDCAGTDVGGEEAEGGESETTERLRCKEHGQERTLYCKRDEEIICVVCAVQGEHQEHEIITLHEAYVWQKSLDGYDLLGCAQEIGQKITDKWNDTSMSQEELLVYVDQQYEKLRKMVLLEEKRTLHLIELKRAYLTSRVAEKIAEINVETKQLHEELEYVNHHLNLLQMAEAGLVNPGAGLIPFPPASSGGLNEARPRFPEPRAAPADPRDLKGDDSEQSMDHAP
ncbi:tripartite motif-containing protein 44 [Synchiropus splendidus]|uniref:tripartite motif-containing protein 44 n=1 Tax=Synchiropus splendidus TaxID=270530 RepID=UPI00237E58FC|nr:tripartite motif-containing protein 44 [Synchiropus splendidus]